MTIDPIDNLARNYAKAPSDVSKKTYLRLGEGDKLELVTIPKAERLKEREKYDFALCAAKLNALLDSGKGTELNSLPVQEFLFWVRGQAVAARPWLLKVSDWLSSSKYSWVKAVGSSLQNRLVKNPTYASIVDIQKTVSEKLKENPPELFSSQVQETKKDQPEEPVSSPQKTESENGPEEQASEVKEKVKESIIPAKQISFDAKMEGVFKECAKSFKKTKPDVAFREVKEKGTYSLEGSLKTFIGKESPLQVKGEKIKVVAGSSSKSAPEVIFRRVIAAGGFSYISLHQRCKASGEIDRSAYLKPKEKNKAQDEIKHSLEISNKLHPAGSENLRSHVITMHGVAKGADRAIEKEKSSPTAPTMFKGILMDFYDGGDLSILRPAVPKKQNESLSPEQRNAIFQMALGVQECHSASVCHMDIKPENFLRRKEDNSDHVVLTDFGISLDMDKDKTTRFKGTRKYAAPELLYLSLKSKPITTSKAMDVFSLGLSMYVICYGETDAFTRYKGCVGAKTVLKDYYPTELSSLIADAEKRGPLGALIASMIQQKPDDRPKIDDVVAQLKTIK